MMRDTREVVSGHGHSPSFSTRYGLRGRRLYLILGLIVLFAVLCVIRKWFAMSCAVHRRCVVLVAISR